jgi:hypothetical protein
MAEIQKGRKIEISDVPTRSGTKYRRTGVEKETHDRRVHEVVLVCPLGRRLGCIVGLVGMARHDELTATTHEVAKICLQNLPQALGTMKRRLLFSNFMAKGSQPLLGVTRVDWAAGARRGLLHVSRSWQ